MVMNFGVCLAESGSGLGSEPHSSRVTVFGFGTAACLAGSSARRVHAHDKPARTSNPNAMCRMEVLRGQRVTKETDSAQFVARMEENRPLVQLFPAAALLPA